MQLLPLGNRDIVFAALKQDYHAIKYVSVALLGDDEFMTEAVERFPRIVECYPIAWRLANKDLMEIAAYKYPSTFVDMPRELMTQELVDYVLSKNPFLLSVVPPHFLNYSLILRAIELEPDAIYFVPNEMLLPSLCARAVLKKPESLSFIPAEFQRKIPLRPLIKALEVDPFSLGYLSDELRENPDLVWAATYANPEAFKYAHESLRANPEIIRDYIDRIDRMDRMTELGVGDRGKCIMYFALG